MSASPSTHLVLWIALAASASLPATAEKNSRQEPANLAAMSLEELMQMRIDNVYGASKYDQKVTRAPASVTILTGEEIALFGHRTLADALRSIRGLYVSDDRNYSYLGARGFLRPGDYNTRVLMLIDGHRMNDNVYDGADFSHDAMPTIDLVDRIEFVRGPSSSIYGSSAFLGVVNVVTKRGAELAGSQVTVAGGSFGEREGHFSAGGLVRGDVEVAFNASYYAKDGQRTLYFPEFDPAVGSDYRAANNGIAYRRDGEESVGFTGSATRGGFTLSGSWLSRKKDVPTASFGTQFNGEERTSDQTGYLDLLFAHDLNPGLQLTGRLSYDRISYFGDYPMEYAAPGDPSDFELSKDETLGSWLTSDWKVMRTLPGGHTLIAGVEYRHSLHQRQLGYIEGSPRVYEVQDDRQESNAALYAQGELALSRKFLLNAGVRYDEYFDSFGGTVNPRVALIYNPSDRSAVKLLYGSAFRAPSAYERFYYVASPEAVELEPETIDTFELVFEQYLGSRDRLNVSLYHYSVDELITQQADSEQVLYFDNLTHVNADGVEVELERKFAGGSLARFSYALQQTENVRTGQRLSSSPRHLAKLNVGLALDERSALGVELQYQSKVATLSPTRARGFTLANMNISREFPAHRLRLSAAIYNLLDERYGYPGAEDHIQNVIEQDGRTFRLILSRRF